jgi:hypothetical protein
MRDERKTMNDERGSKDNGSPIHHSSFRVHRSTSSLIPAIRMLHLTVKKGVGEYDMALKMRENNAAGPIRDLHSSLELLLSLQAHRGDYCWLSKFERNKGSE